MVFTQLYPDKTPNYYTYFPLSFLLTIPAWLLFGDIRYTFAVAELVFCAVLYSLGRKNPSVPNQREIYNFLILIFLFHPLGTFIIEESWLDPLILALLAVFGLGYISSKKTAWPFLLISTTIGIKQNMLMIIPFLFKLKSFDFKKLILGFLPVILVILFFFLLSPSNFISDTIIEPYTRTQRSDALTLFSFLKNQGIILPSIVSLSIPFVFLILFLKKGWSSIANFYLAFTIWFFSSLLFFREAFLNQYYFASSLLLLSIAFALNEYNS